MNNEDKIDYLIKRQKEEDKFWQETVNNIKTACIFALILAPLMVMGFFLLKWLNPELLERLIDVIKWI